MATTFPFRVFLFVIVLAALVHAFNFGVDPLQVYRKQTRLKPLFSEQQRLQVPGLTRHYSSDATRLVVGSSMTANFRSDEIDGVLGGRTLKLSINGSTAFEQLFVLNQALTAASSHRTIESVLWGIDLGRFNENYGAFSQETGAYPMHLYQGYPGLLKYTLSLQTTLHSVRTILGTAFGYSFPLESQSIDTLNTWNRNTGCGAVLQHLDNIAKQSGFLENRGFTFREDMFARHLDDIVATAQPYPNIEFVVFYSPYSIVRYKRLEQLGGVEHFLKLRQEFDRRVRAAKNVKVVDLQAQASIVTNLDYYKDVGHFDNRVNHVLLQRISERKFDTSEDVSTNSAELKRLVLSTDLDVVRSECRDYSG